MRGNLLHYPAFQGVLATPAYVRHKVSHSFISEHWVPSMCPASDTTLTTLGTAVRDQKSCLSLVVVQSLSHVQLFATLWTTAHQASLSFSITRSLLKLMSVESVISSNHLILCRPLLLLPSLFPSIRVFSCDLALLIRWPKCWNFNFSNSPTNKYSGLISFRMDWFDLPGFTV